MKLSIKRTDLLDALGIVKPAARGTLEILRNVLVTANEKSVTLACADLDVFLRCRANASVSAKGEVTVRAALLHGIASTGVAEDVFLEAKGGKLHATCGTGKFVLATLEAKDFPAFPRIKDPIELALDDASLRAMLAAVSFASSDDSTRFCLNGVLLQVLGEQGVNLVATDGRRAALINGESPIAKKFDRIIPDYAVRELLRLLGSDEDKPARCEVVVGNSLIQFNFGEVTMLAKLIDGTFPDYRKIMPDDKSPVATVDRAALLAAVERVTLVADAATLAFGKAALEIQSHHSKAKDKFGDASDRLLVPASREVKCTLAAQYLCDALKATSEASLEFFHDSRGIVMFKTGPGAARPWRAVIASLPDDKGRGASCPANGKVPAAEPAKTESKQS